MTLKEFQRATSTVPEPALRRAMAAALCVEPARTPDAYRRFYARVVDILGLATAPPALPHVAAVVCDGYSRSGDCHPS